jgi:hypothetical protein
LPRPTVEQSETDDQPTATDTVAEHPDFTITPSATVTTATSKYPDCDTNDLTIGTYTIAACNIGATQAGTGETSYGSLFQRGNNFGFSNNATNVAPSPNSLTRPNVAAY